MRKIGSSLLLVVLMLVLVTGCGIVGNVPKADLDAANAKLDAANAQIAAKDNTITTLQTNLQTAQADVAKANTEYNRVMIELNAAKAENQDYFRKLAKFESLICKQSWSDIAITMGMWFPYAGLDPNLKDFDGYVMFTQWQPAGGLWDNNLYATTILFDTDKVQALAIDTEADCIFVNPSFSDLGK